MDLKAKHLSDKCSDPIEFLNQLRQTTESIGGGTEYSDDGELVEYEVAIIAIDKATNALIEKACDAYCKICGHFAHTTPTHICRHDCIYYSDFVKQLKE